MKILIAIFILASLLSTQANSALISTDWKASGDGLLTVDTKTGLEWLDATQTTSMSFLDISDQFVLGEYFYGFRYATTEEVDGLVASAGGVGNYHNYPFTYPKDHVQDIVVTNLLIDLLGYTHANTTESSYIYGITSDIYSAYSSEIGRYPDPNRRWLHLIQSGYPSSDVGYVSLNASGLYITHDPFNSGSFLVRDTAPVPEPSTILLLSSGLLGLGWYGRKRKNA